MKRLTALLFFSVFFITLTSSALFADEQEVTQFVAELLQQSDIKANNIKYNEWQGMLTVSNLNWQVPIDNDNLEITVQKAILKNFQIKDEQGKKEVFADSCILQGLHSYLRKPKISIEYEASHLHLDGNIVFSILEVKPDQANNADSVNQLVKRFFSALKDAVSDQENTQEKISSQEKNLSESKQTIDDQKKLASTPNTVAQTVSPKDSNTSATVESVSELKKNVFQPLMMFDMSKAQLSAIDNTLTIQETNAAPVYLGFSELKINAQEKKPLQMTADNIFFRAKEGESAYAWSINHSVTVSELSLSEFFNKLGQILSYFKKEGQEKAVVLVSGKALNSRMSGIKLRYIPSVENFQNSYDVTVSEISSSNSSLTESHAEFDFNMKELNIPALGLAKQFNLKEEYINSVQAFIKDNVVFSLGLTGRCNAGNKPSIFNVNLSSLNFFDFSGIVNFHIPMKTLPTEETAFANALAEKGLIDSVTFKYDDHNFIPFCTVLGSKLTKLPQKMAITIFAGMVSAKLPKEAALPFLELIYKPGSISGKFTANKPIIAREFFNKDIFSKAKLEAKTVQGTKTLDECIPAEIKK